MPNPPPKVPIFLVVRVDFPPLPSYEPDRLRDRITVVEAFPTADEAQSESDRLTRLNAGKDCVYFWTGSRYYPEGRQVQEGY